MPFFPLLQHPNAPGRPKRDATPGAARLAGTRLRPPLVEPAGVTAGIRCRRMRGNSLGETAPE